MEPDDLTIPTLAIDDEIERRQKANLARIKSARSASEAISVGSAFVARQVPPRT